MVLLGRLHRLRVKSSLAHHADVGEWVPCWNGVNDLLLDLWLDQVWQLLSLQTLHIDVHVFVGQSFEVTVARPFGILDELLQLAEELNTRLGQINLGKQLPNVASLGVDDVLDSDAEVKGVVDFKSLLNFVLEVIGLGPGSELQEAKLGLLDGLQVLKQLSDLGLHKAFPFVVDVLVL